MIRADRVEDETGISLDMSTWTWEKYKSTGLDVRAVRAPQPIRLVPTDIVKETVEVPTGHWLVEFSDGAFEVLGPASFYRKYRKDE